MLFKSLFAIGCIAAAAVADGVAINNALVKIDGDTAKLNNTIVAFKGDLFTALPIVSAATTLLDDINKGADTAKKSANLTDSEAINLTGSVLKLANDVNITLTNLINAKPKFTKLFLNGAIEFVLQQEKSATDKLSANIIAKVPSALQPLAKSLVAPIEQGFEKAIAVYKS